MKHALLLTGAIITALYSTGQTGSAAYFQKVSSEEGGLQSPLSNSGKFGYVFESQTPNLIFSGAPNAGNGEFHIITLAEDGTVAEEQKVSAQDFPFFDDQVQAEFGASVADLGDLNQDGINELLVGAPGLDGGKLFALTSSEAGYELQAITLPTAVENASERLGEFLFQYDGNVLTTSIHNEGVIYRFTYDNNIELTLVETIGSDHPLLEGKLDNGDRFGSGLSVADVTGDGIKDILCGAPGDDDQNTDFGALYLLYRGSNESITGIQKISRLEGDFGGFLNVGDRFGETVRSIGDLDQNGTVDLAVGAPGDDDGGTDVGSVWILFRHPEGWVINERKINRFEGNFTFDLGSDDNLAERIATIGDLNGDGTMDLVASVPGDDDGGSDRGGFFTIFLEFCPPPSGDYDYEVEGPTVQFFAEGGEGYSYIWNFDDGGYSEEQNPVHTYENSGTYSVCLAINSECGGDNFCKNVSVNATLSTEDTAEESVLIYPNPASEFIKVKGLTPQTAVRIIDITGKLIYQGIPGANGRLDLSEFNEGLYLLEAQANGLTAVRKFKVIR